MDLHGGAGDHSSGREEAERGISDLDLVAVAEPAPPPPPSVDAGTVARLPVDQDEGISLFLHGQVLPGDGDVRNDDGVRGSAPEGGQRLDDAEFRSFVRARRDQESGRGRSPLSAGQDRRVSARSVPRRARRESSGEHLRRWSAWIRRIPPAANPRARSLGEDGHSHRLHRITRHPLRAARKADCPAPFRGNRRGRRRGNAGGPHARSALPARPAHSVRTAPP
jgi:hypothetical protein